MIKWSNKKQSKEYLRHHFLIILLHFIITITLLLRVFTYIRMLKILYNDMLLLISSQLSIQWCYITSLILATEENIYTMEIGKNYKSRFSFSLIECVIKYLSS